MDHTPIGQTAQILRGHTITIPNLYRVFSTWTSHMNPHAAEVKAGVEAYIERYVQGEGKKKKYLASKINVLARLVYPDASAESCVLGGKYIAWLFFWDDVLDCGELTSSNANVQMFVDETVKILQPGCTDPTHQQSSGQLHPAIKAVNEVAQETAHLGSCSAQRRFLAENIAHVQASGSLLLASQPSHSKTLKVSEYLDLRVPDSGSPASQYLSEFVYGLRIPEWVFEMEDMQTIIRETAIMVPTINDLLSLPKEVRNEPDAVSLVPILMQQERLTAQGAIDRAVKILEDSYERFLVAEQMLRDYLGADPCFADVMKFVQAGKDLVMGTMEWSYGTDRYMSVEGVKRMENGGLVCKL